MVLDVRWPVEMSVLTGCWFVLLVCGAILPIVLPLKVMIVPQFQCKQYVYAARLIETRFMY
jgi:hypothetical protein